jgi:Rod binding domain-containing protein
MTISSHSISNAHVPPVQAGAAAQPHVESAAERKLKDSAGQFESMMLANLWKSMKESFASDDDSTDPAKGTLDNWGIEIMSGAVGKAGGLGLGKLILQQLEPALHKQETSGPSGAVPEAQKPSSDQSGEEL